MFYSHVWDLLLKCLTFLSIGWISATVHDRAGMHADAVVPIMAGAIVIGLIVYRQFVSILSPWLYARINLGVPVSFSDAKELRTLFQLHFGGSQPVGWFPMKEVKQLPANERRIALMTELGRVKREHRRMLL
jgi:hypothetical protein